MNLDMSLWEHDALIEKIVIEQFFLGIYYGIMFVMALYNLFVYFSIRENTYIFYVAFIGFYTMFQLSLNGLGYKFFDSHLLFWFNNSIPLFMAITTTFGLLFTRYFLHSAEITPIFDKYMKFLLAANIACVVFSLFAGYHISIKLTTLLVTITIISMTINGFLCLFRGYRSARFYVLGWVAFLVGGLFQTMKAFGLVDVNFFTVWSQQIGSAAEVTLLSLALADRINIIEREKSEAREKLLIMEKDYSVTLENTVREKTEELQSERNMLKTRNDEMIRDIALAKKIQKRIIPSGAPVSFIESLYRPMDELGGDYYDFIQFEDPEKIGIFISDVSGHGVPAAFITSMIKTIILQADDRKEDPAELLKHINDVLVNQTAGNFVTAYYCVYNPADKTLLSANAGHNFPYLITRKKIFQPEGRSCVPLGIMSCEELGTYNKSYQNTLISLEAGGKLFLYTDGLTEARSPDDPSQFFDENGLIESMRKHRHLKCGEFVAALYEGLIAFKKGNRFEDDVCIVCMDII